MKGFILTAMFALATTAFAVETDAFKITKHDHKHSADCGHKTVQHGDHMDYIDGDHFHAAHLDHFDVHGMVDMKRKTASADHKMVEGHKDHKHGEKCGHDMIVHGDHSDFLHDGQYHCQHGTHWDIHGGPVAAAH